MAKPILADSRFASAVGANRVAPSPGRRDSGYQDGDTVPDGEHNYLFHQAYLWAQWLDEDKTIPIPAAAMRPGEGTGTPNFDGQFWGMPSGYFLHAPIVLPVGAVIKNVAVRYSRPSGTVLVELWERASSGGTLAAAIASQTDSSSSGITTTTVSFTKQIPSDKWYEIRVNGSAGVSVVGAWVTHNFAT